MPLSEEILGTNADGTKNEEYCIYCHKDGAFTGDFTMEQMVEYCSMFVETYNKNTGQNLPQEAYAAGTLIHQYQQVQHRFHQGTILPIGEEPSGRSWTGFQSLLSDSEGYLLVYRELTDRTTAELDTWLPGGRDVTLQPVLGDAATPRQTTVSDTGRIRLSLPAPHTFALYHYRVN